MKPWEQAWSGDAPAASASAPPWQQPWSEAGDERARRIAREVSGGDPTFVDFASRVARLESSSGANRVGPVVERGMHAGDRARGMWQVMPKTFAGEGGRNIEDDDEADRVGAGYLWKNYQRFGRDERKAAQAHFAGPGSVRADGQIPAGGDGQMSIRGYVDRTAGGKAPPWQINWTK